MADAFDLTAEELAPGLLHYDYEQGSERWKAAKLGVPSASMFSAVMAGGDGKTRTKYLKQLAGEAVSGREREDFKSKAMERGNAMEPELRGLYAMIANTEPKPCGFFKCKVGRGFAGASPDSLIGDDGQLEIKSAAPDLLIDILKCDRVPPEHVAQLQGSLLVTGRAWVDLAIGYGGMPMLRKRVKRDESAIARLRVGLEQFNDELNDLVAWLRGYGKP